MSRRGYDPVDAARLPDLLAAGLADAEPPGVALADAEPPGVALRVAVDGPPSTDPHALADRLVEPLRLLGRPALRVRAETFWRDASLRFEHGRKDVDAFRDDWLDAAALRREVLDPVGPGGSGDYLPSLRDPETNRATREPRRAAPPGAVLIVSGALLLDRGLPFDCTIHLATSAAARARRTPPEWAWALPAFDEYETDVNADVVIRYDDPAHPAISRAIPFRSGTT